MNQMKETAMRKSIVTVLAALSISGIMAVPASAEEMGPVETVSVTVQYGDLNLQAPADSAKLDKRIEAAAGDVCRKPDIRDVKAMSAWEECKAEAKAGALEQLSILDTYENLALASLF